MIETGNFISRRYQLQAQIVARRLPQVLQRRGLEAPFTEFLLTSTQGMVLLFAILDLPKVKRLEAYTTPELLHHLSTDLRVCRFSCPTRTGCAMPSRSRLCRACQN